MTALQVLLRQQWQIFNDVSLPQDVHNGMMCFHCIARYLCMYMRVCMYECMSVCLSVCLAVCLSVCLSRTGRKRVPNGSRTGQSVCVSVQSVGLSVSQSGCVSISRSVSPPVLFSEPSIYLHVAFSETSFYFCAQFFKAFGYPRVALRKRVANKLRTGTAKKVPRAIF